MQNERPACEYKCEYRATNEELKSPRDIPNNLTYCPRPAYACIIYANFCIAIDRRALTSNTVLILRSVTRHLIPRDYLSRDSRER